MYELLSAWWELIATIGGGIGAAVLAWYKWKANQQSSIEMMLDEMESIKKNLVNKISAEIKHAEAIAAAQIELSKKQQLISEVNRKLKAIEEACPDCYEKATNQAQ